MVTIPAGILAHLSAIPSPYGVGTLGKPARDWIDFLAAAGQSGWQLLPLGPVGPGYSPYQTNSSYAGDPIYIDPEPLYRAGWISKESWQHCLAETPEGPADYDRRRTVMRQLLRESFQYIDRSVFAAVDRFAEEQPWVTGYTRFVAFAEYFGAPWIEWPEPIRRGDRAAVEALSERLWERIAFERYVQWLFDQQYHAMRDYARQRGIAILGDLPIYPALDSADVWTHPDCFELGRDGRPTRVAGVPPDAFSADGQRWDNPLYRWERIAADGYRLWTDRMLHMARLYDCVRIDHFRGIESYWAVPAGAPTAREGVWLPGPGLPLIEAITGALQKAGASLSLIAEDLGIITDAVRALRKKAGIPGMKVLHFAFGSGEGCEYLPQNYEDANTVVYTGTHDNDTTLGWYRSLPDWERAFVDRTLGRHGEIDIHWSLIQLAMGSVAANCIIPIQDYLGFGSEARFNIPGTPSGNWRWRIPGRLLTDGLARRIRAITAAYGRLPAAGE